ncbi:MAG TPA: hypothetical protein ENK01_00975 [Hellea balneolensis]|uniref:Uncharacterized protein n=1 Tax=Hellea balneolensis TaxID=287478 RepID=A0A7V5U0U4_9PROT|nr:hypothetical protein [Hellea balneolensis]
MKKYVQDEKPPISQEAKAWMDEETKAQEARYKAIVEEIDGMEEQRAEWIEEFLHLIQTRGFYVTGDTKVKIPKEDVPQKPDRPDAMRVIW